MGKGSSNLVDRVRGKDAGGAPYDLASEATLDAIRDILADAWSDPDNAIRIIGTVLATPTGTQDVNIVQNDAGLALQGEAAAAASPLAKETTLQALNALATAANALLQDIKTNTANTTIEADEVNLNVDDLEELSTAANALLQAIEAALLERAREDTQLAVLEKLQEVLDAIQALEQDPLTDAQLRASPVATDPIDRPARQFGRVTVLNQYGDPIGPAEEGTLQALKDLIDDRLVAPVPGQQDSAHSSPVVLSTEQQAILAARASEDTLTRRNNVFATLINAQPRSTGEEIRLDDIVAGDLYIGRNTDGAAEASATWEVVRIYRTSTGSTTRIRYRSGVAWTARTAGWT